MTRNRLRRVLAVLLVALVSGAAMAGPPVPATAHRILDQGLNETSSMAFAPGDVNRMFVVDRTGIIRVLELDTRTLRATSFLDISSVVGSIPGEVGLLDIKFDPDYDTNGFFYIAYNENRTRDLFISRWSVSGDPNVADADSELVLKVVDHTMLAHNGGQLQFGPNDGFLYFSSGDGSNAAESDLDGNSQNLSILHGKILRLDVDNPPGYIAAGNPFVEIPKDDPSTRAEIWAYGLRNPWRFSFDRLTGDLYLADVGRGNREEIDFQPASSAGAENYGWNCMEAELCTEAVVVPNPACTCNDVAITPPIRPIEHVDMPCDTVIGGYVYRGAGLPQFTGRYLYSDYCQGYMRTFVVSPDGGGGWVAGDDQEHTELNPDAVQWITSFAEDPSGELYYCTRGFQGHPSAIYKIAPVVSGDATGDGLANVSDLVAVILAWGPCLSTCSEDFNGDGEINVLDLLEVILNWTT